ncbi:MAG: adenylosuccinate synthase [Halobacteria archaeon]|nr:adenylosuccinate synthase [Halobacteria archaeon]
MGAGVTIVGSQLGDEGKGKITDLYGESADVIVRFQGGDNAGHTVVADGEEFKLHLVPSGVIRGKTAVVGNGCVVNPTVLLEEIEELREKGIDPDLYLAERAHIIMPYHRVLDGMEEDAKGDMAAGTTGRGIGPCYEDKVGRRGVRALDLLNPDRLREKLEYVVPRKRAVVEDVYGLEAGDEFDVDEIYEEYVEYGEELEDWIINASEVINQRLDDGDDVLFEGAQGTSLDIDHGIYPYLTSSNTTVGGACTGTGVGATRLDETVGVMKAYLSRVGTGPLPTELENDVGDHLVEVGNEYGTTTGRRRRVGWFDLPMVRHASRINDFTGGVITSIDVLDGLDEVKVCEAYDLDGERVESIPADMDDWARCEPVYERFDGWEGVDWDAIETYDEIPENARAYVEYLEDELDTEFYAVSVGPGREQTIIRTNPFDKP